MSKVSYTTDQRKEALQLKSAGVSNDQIAEKTGLKISSVNRMFPRPKPEVFTNENPHLEAARSWERRQILAKQIGALSEDDRRELLAQLAGHSVK